jgi:hypothetical protein
MTGLSGNLLPHFFQRHTTSTLPRQLKERPEIRSIGLVPPAPGTWVLEGPPLEGLKGGNGDTTWENGGHPPDYRPRHYSGVPPTSRVFQAQPSLATLLSAEVPSRQRLPHNTPPLSFSVSLTKSLQFLFVIPIDSCAFQPIDPSRNPGLEGKKKRTQSSKQTNPYCALGGVYLPLHLETPTKEGKKRLLVLSTSTTVAPASFSHPPPPTLPTAPGASSHKADGALRSRCVEDEHGPRHCSAPQPKRPNRCHWRSPPRPPPPRLHRPPASLFRLPRTLPRPAPSQINLHLHHLPSPQGPLRRRPRRLLQLPTSRLPLLLRRRRPRRLDRLPPSTPRQASLPGMP